MKKHGLTVVGEAETSEVGEELFNKLNPDYVTLDIDLPEADAFDLLDKLSDISQETGTIIIVVSEKGQKSSVLKCVENGADMFVVKPFNEKILITSLIRANNEDHRLYSSNMEYYEERLEDITDDSTMLTQHEIDSRLLGLHMSQDNPHYALDSMPV